MTALFYASICIALACAYILRGRASDAGLPLLAARLIWAGTFAAAAGLLFGSWWVFLTSGIGAYLANLIPYGYYSAGGLYAGNKHNWLGVPKQNLFWCSCAMAIIGFGQGLLLFQGIEWRLAFAVALLNPLAALPFRPSQAKREALYGLGIGIILIGAALWKQTVA